MAYNVDIYNSSVFLKMDTDPYGIHVTGSNIGQPTAQRSFSGALNIRYAPLLNSVRENRMIELPLQMTGDSMDDWIINVQQLMAILRDAELYNDLEGYGQKGDRAFIALQMPNATNTTVWEILCGDLTAGELFQSVVAMNTPLMPVATLRLICHKWGHPQQYNRVISGTLDNGGAAYILSAPAGERESPCKVIMQTAAGDDWRRVILARRAQGNVNNLVLDFECETGTYTGYVTTDIHTASFLTLSNVVDATSHGGKYLRLDKDVGSGPSLTTIIMVTINDNLEDFRGRYKVFLIGKAPNGGANFSEARVCYGGIDGRAKTGETVSVPASMSANDGLYLGDVEIPYPWTPPGAGSNASFSFSIDASLANANFNSDWDFIRLIPADQYSEIQLTSANSAAQDQMVWDYLSIPGNTYLLDVNGDVQADGFTWGKDQRFTVVPGKDNLWSCIFGETTAEAARKLGRVNLTDDYTLEFYILPLYELLI